MQPNLEDPLLEKNHVLNVYDEIAPHFSATRYKPWPVIEKFLNSLETGSIGLDNGCGNGKYLNVNTNIFTIGSDLSSGLLQVCKARKEIFAAKKLEKVAGFHYEHDLLISDVRSLPYRDFSFDFIINVAVIHHLAKEEDRITAVKEMLRCLKKGGKMLVYVWAFEQESKKFTETDLFVPWNLDHKQCSEKKVLLRYYHLFKKGELDALFENIGEANIIQSGYDKDNWYIIASKI